MKLFDSPAPAAALAAALTLTVAAPAYAGDKSDDIVVSSKSAMVTWQQDTTRQLNRMLARTPVAHTAAPNDTIVQIEFTLGEDGRPTDITLLDGDANWSARQTAIYAVRRLGDLSDVPVTNPQGTRFLANLIFADNAETRDQLAAKLDRSERTRLAAADGEEEPILLGG